MLAISKNVSSFHLMSLL